MAEQWISAATVRSLLPELASIAERGVTLCRRAEAGLIKSKARLLIMDERRTESAEIPRDFWSPGTSFGMEQNWDVGDFSLVGERQAFGVTFALSGVVEMLPVERRAVATKQLSVAGNPAWITARAARVIPFQAGVSRQHTGAVILDQARLGFITARAVLAERSRSGKSPRFFWNAREWDVPDWFWREFTRDGKSSQDWERGIFTGEGRGPEGECSATLTGVYFLAESLQVLPPPIEPAAKTEELPTEAPSQLNPGGRPPREWWDDMWCAVWGQIYRGDFEPKTQAAVEKAMHDWAAAHGHEPAVSTIRPKARKLIAACKAEVENPPAP